ncbi:alanine racemase [Microbulbifer thermotolerans]|uniref:Alanine racemase n=1 Tax=Microbulbifer thermotolerans TaxID=252514 RepID=A0AB35HXH7_MICTH|nr:alanine racemase [Microbulbifer thermotolerans]MCX2779833.1 alanine racemase [Microbulbifer thermotolerans]MCX2781646.1 alanine racemase [Microbulbifer thermotolerans]MCX2794805.1 alanine racemase [Microbulbifer thermotolerans]MCX2802287.1 alanine racemase [Microbulbifer thermotolerans]MCX2805140.1 alanine racemase [Microbulbifer thermotolerans]
MSRPLRAEIDLEALAHNYRYAKSLSHGRTLAVIKADAYGHGLLRVAQCLCGGDGFAVATIEEAVALREAGLRNRILVLEGVFDREGMCEAAWRRLDLVVHSGYQLELLKALPETRPLSIWLKVDTGMGRLGFDGADAPGIYADLAALSAVRECVLITHLACADEADSPHNHLQLQRFDATARAIETQRTVRSLPFAQSIANSAALIGLPDARRQWDRAGVMLYGINPHMGSGQDHNLKSAMTLRSRLIAVRSARAGESVGYGCDYRFYHDGRFGIVACGYGDGYPRHAPSGTPVLVCGRRAQLIGRVSMDMLAVDLSAIPEARVGTEVELWGGALPVAEIAASAGSIAYELLTGVTQRVPRVYGNGTRLESGGGADRAAGPDSPAP